MFYFYEVTNGHGLIYPVESSDVWLFDDRVSPIHLGSECMFMVPPTREEINAG